MIITYSFQRAKIILELIMERLKYYKTIDRVIVECYQNGREHGFTVIAYDHEFVCRVVTFSESRNSDCTVVYLDNKAFQGLTEASYYSAEYFDYNEHYKAAEYCCEKLAGRASESCYENLSDRAKEN